ncbi:hypothetical protein BT69DRAFT_1349716 [Atractiella rhizophila]|nr:hypothetical protein BT69DRAFT_1349716 [Atractiella rhizophila]
MSRRSPPLLGSAYLEAPPTPPSIQNVDMNTCLNLSTFKYIMRQYRALDDSIIVRLNRNAALFRQNRDRDGSASSNSLEDARQEECTKIWSEMLANWRGREQLIHYCVKTVDARLEEKRRQLYPDGEAKLDPSAQVGTGRIKEELITEEATKNQIHNELAIESIVRRRSFEAFKSSVQCRFFEPPTALKVPLDLQAEEEWTRR